MLFAQYLRHIIYPFYDRLVVLTEHDKQRWNTRNCIVIPNYTTFQSSTRHVCKEKIVIAVGRLSEQKCLSRLIDAWHLIYKYCGDYKLFIYGDGPLYNDLVNQIRCLGMEKSVFLKGNVSNIEDVYQSASFLVMSSKYEGLPMVAIEAFQFALPIVAYNIPGMESVITNYENGILVEDGNTEAFAKAMLSLINDSGMLEKMSRKALDVSSLYLEKNIMDRWERLFDVLISEKR